MDLLPPSTLQFWQSLTTLYPLFPVWHPLHKDHPKTDSPTEYGKLPATMGWQNTTIPQSEQQLSQLLLQLQDKGSAGIALQSSHLVIDVDVASPLRPDKEGDTYIKKLNEDLGINLIHAASAVVVTGSGGFHLYFSIPPEYRSFRIRKKLPQYKDLDFLSAGRYVLAPYAQHLSGNIYQPHPARSNFTSLAPAPKALLDLLIAAPNANSLASATDTEERIYYDTEENVKRAIAHVQSLPPAIQGKNGDDATYRAAALCKDYGLSPRATFHVLDEAYNPRCNPPWSVTELEQKVGNAYQYTATDTPRTLLPSADLLGLSDSSASQLTASEVASIAQDVMVNHTWTTQIHVNGRSQQPDRNRAFENISTVLQHHPTYHRLFGHNLLSNKVCLRRKPPFDMLRELPEPFPAQGIPLTDADYSTIRMQLAQLLIPTHPWAGFSASQATVMEAVNYVATLHPYHPIKDVIKDAALRYDQQPRLYSWLPRVLKQDPDCEYMRHMSWATAIALVQRVFEPASKYDLMLVLAGKEGTRKSTFCKTLAILPEWFSDTRIDYEDPKSIAEALEGVWVKEEAELAGFNRASTESLKSILSSGMLTNVRKAWGRTTNTLHLSNIFMATTNNLHFVREDAGLQRRLCPVVINEPVDIDYLDKNIRHIIGEAYLVYMDFKQMNPKYTMNLDNMSEEAHRKVSVLRIGMSEDSDLADSISLYLGGQNPLGVPIEKLRLGHLVQDVMGIPNATGSGTQGKKCAAILTRLGWGVVDATDERGTRYREWRKKERAE